MSTQPSSARAEAAAALLGRVGPGVDVLDLHGDRGTHALGALVEGGVAGNHLSKGESGHVANDSLLGGDGALVDHLLHDLVDGEQAVHFGQAILVLGLQDDHRAVGLLELGAQYVAGIAHSSSKADQRGGHIQAFKAAGHAVLAADGAIPRPI